MIIINFILFQVAWFACVIGAGKAMPWLGVVVTIVALVWHLYCTKQIKPELSLMLSALIIGGAFDQVMLSYSYIGYVSNGWDVSLVPIWILALWLAFATTLNVSLRWMRGRYFVAIFFGSIGGPIAYFGAEKLGAVMLHGYSSYIALSIGWAIITPLLLSISSYFDGFVGSDYRQNKFEESN